MMAKQPITDLVSAVRSLTEAATRTLASRDGQPLTEAVLRHYRDDARAVTVAVLRTLAGGPSGTGVVTPPKSDAIRMSDLADAIERSGEE